MIMHPIGSVKIDVPVGTATRLWRDGELDCRLSRISPVHLRRRPASSKTEINTLSDTRRYRDDDRNGGQELQENIRTIAYDNKVIRYRLQKSFLSVDPTTTGTINDNNQEIMSHNSNNSNSRTIINDATYLVVEIEIDLLKRHSLLNYFKAKMFAKGFQQKVQEVLEQFKEYADEDYYIERLEKKQRLLNNFLYKKKPAAAASSFWNHNFVNDSSSSLHSSITSLPKEGERLETIVEDEE